MPSRILQGVVVGDKADKTVVVLVERRIMHPLYKKYITRSKRFAAHDADNRCRVGDKVRIRECPPISKSKAYTVIYDETTGPARPAANTAAAAPVEAATPAKPKPAPTAAPKVAEKAPEPKAKPKAAAKAPAGKAPAAKAKKAAKAKAKPAKKAAKASAKKASGKAKKAPSGK